MINSKIIVSLSEDQVIKFSPFQSKDTLNLGVIKLASDYVLDYGAKEKETTSAINNRFIPGHILQNSIIGAYNTLKYSKSETGHNEYTYSIITEAAVEQIFPINESITFNPAERYLKSLFKAIYEHRNPIRNTAADLRFSQEAQSEGIPTQQSINTATSDLNPDFVMNFLRNISQKINSVMIQNIYYRQTHFDPDYALHNMLTLNDRNALKCITMKDPFDASRNILCICTSTDKKVANFGTIKVINAPSDLQLYIIIRGIPIQMRKRITSVCSITADNVEFNNVEFVAPEYLIGNNMHVLESISHIRIDSTDLDHVKEHTKFYTGINDKDNQYKRFGTPNTVELFDYAANCNILNAYYRNISYTTAMSEDGEYIDPDEVLIDPWWEEKEKDVEEDAIV